MPAILAPDNYAHWLAAESENPASFQSLLRPCPSEWLAAYPISKAVNNARHEGEELLRPLPSQ